jgi:hypothetical protein
MTKKASPAGPAAAVAEPAAAANRFSVDTHAKDGLPYPMLGALVVYTVPGNANPELYQNGIRQGSKLPAVICRVLELTPEAETRVNLRVFADGDDGDESGVVHVACVHRGHGLGRYQPLQATVHK